LEGKDGQAARPPNPPEQPSSNQPSSSSASPQESSSASPQDAAYVGLGWGGLKQCRTGYRDKWQEKYGTGLKPTVDSRSFGEPKTTEIPRSAQAGGSGGLSANEAYEASLLFESQRKHDHDTQGASDQRHTQPASDSTPAPASPETPPQPEQPARVSPTTPPAPEPAHTQQPDVVSPPVAEPEAFTGPRYPVPRHVAFDPVVQVLPYQPDSASRAGDGLPEPEPAPVPPQEVSDPPQETRV